MDKINLSPRITGSPVLKGLYKLLVLLGILGPFLILYTELVPLLWVTNYDLLRDSVSSVSWTRMGWIQDIGFIITGFFVEAFAAILAIGIRRARGFSFGVILLAFSGFLLLLVGIFPSDSQGLLPTIYSMLHGLAANTLSIFLPIAILFITPSLRKDSYSRSLFIYSLATAVLIFSLIGLYQLWLPNKLDWFGLYERILALVGMVWIEVVAIYLLPLYRRPVQSKLTVSPDLVIPEQQLS